MKELKDFTKVKYDINLFILGINAKIFQTLLNNVILMLTHEKIQYLIKLLLLGKILKMKNFK